ncbi:MAG: BREX-2 system adenine-specific DNA-methyltransferase PglX [Planctomycetes bacterium]|nr:BREX-2 system adenine-specific DNA-methyltransferase PglX [Planctomycetota bacterium]
MIVRPRLLADLQRQLALMEEDLRLRMGEQPAVLAAMRAEHARAKEAGRTAHSFELWSEEFVTQVGVAWLLAAVFVRFLEDNDLVAEPKLGGVGARLERARDLRLQWFHAHLDANERDWLLAVFDEVATLPGMGPLFDRSHNPLFVVGPSADRAKELLQFFEQQDGATGALRHDFTDPARNTRFLGDLYQELSESAQKRFALLQTPEFIEEFILDRTLEPACAEFGFEQVKLIDPTCGSGHFLLGAFPRLLKRWQQKEPGTNVTVLVQRTLDALHGVDVNPFAIAIARFRLLVAALTAAGVKRLAGAFNFKTQLATGDSLLHGARTESIRGVQRGLHGDERSIEHAYATEDAAEAKRLLEQRYHVVVGNPPYITPKDAALNEAYRAKYATCHRKYSLGVPFTERFFDLALGSADPVATPPPAGYVGMITANSFMKREFGKKLIEEFLDRRDLTHVIDTSGAYIPGHGTPTVILFARHRPARDATMRAVLGIRGEPTTPDDPARGQVWREIVDHVDRPGFTGAFVSVSDIERGRFAKHPWSIGGGGASELKELIDERATSLLQDHVVSIGFGAVLGEDEAFSVDTGCPKACELPREMMRPLVVGDLVRDWQLSTELVVAFPYNEAIELVDSPLLQRWLWPMRTVLRERLDFSKTTYRERGRPWFEYHQLPIDRNRTPLSIAFAFVATHNHFVLDRGGKVFKQSAPVIKLPPDATEDDHLGVLGLLNSSLAGFWLRQVCHDKGNGGYGGGIANEEWERFFEFTGTKVEAFPLPAQLSVELGRRLDSTIAELAATAPLRVLCDGVPSRTTLDAARVRYSALFQIMTGVQEELDWATYAAFALTPEALVSTAGAVPIELGTRAFEIVLARDVASGKQSTEWFARHGSKPITELPSQWPAAYRQLVERRIAEIESNANVRLIERPEYKRRWASESWEVQEERALRQWLLARLEERRFWPEAQLLSGAQLADRVRHDGEFLQVAELYTKRADFDLTALVTTLALDEAVPYLPRLRYRDSGLRKRALWEKCWELQRREDAGEKVGPIEPPPKYAAADFLPGPSWRLRGKLDVPKERFVLVPGAELAGDPTPVVTWAGFDAREQAQALAARYVTLRDDEAAPPERLGPLLAGLDQLVPWLKQWHNALDPATGLAFGNYFEEFVDGEARRLGKTLAEVRVMVPPMAARRRKTKTQAKGDA